MNKVNDRMNERTNRKTLTMDTSKMCAIPEANSIDSTPVSLSFRCRNGSSHFIPSVFSCCHHFELQNSREICVNCSTDFAAHFSSFSISWYLVCLFVSLNPIISSRRSSFSFLIVALALSLSISSYCSEQIRMFTVFISCYYLAEAYSASTQLVTIFFLSHKITS